MQLSTPWRPFSRPYSTSISHRVCPFLRFQSLITFISWLRAFTFVMQLSVFYRGRNFHRYQISETKIGRISETETGQIWKRDQILIFDLSVLGAKHPLQFTLSFLPIDDRWIADWWMNAALRRTFSSTKTFLGGLGEGDCSRRYWWGGVINLEMNTCCDSSMEVLLRALLGNY